MSVARLAVQHCILSAEAASGAVTDLLQHVREEGVGRFGGDVIEGLAEALKLACAVELWALDKAVANLVKEHGYGHRIVLRQQMVDEAERLTVLLEAVRVWEEGQS